MAEDHPGTWLFQNVGFGLGVGWTHNLGPRRVESVSVTPTRIVRIDDERNDLARVVAGRRAAARRADLSAGHDGARRRP